jgi:hypothetical protein
MEAKYYLITRIFADCLYTVSFLSNVENIILTIEQWPIHSSSNFDKAAALGPADLVKFSAGICL